MPMVMISSARQRLCDAEIPGVRRRLDLARRFAIGASDTMPAEGWRALLVLAYRTYAADVAALLEDRRRQLQDLAALRRVALSAELALDECRDGDPAAERVEQLLRALQLAGYGLRSPSRAEG